MVWRAMGAIILRNSGLAWSDNYAGLARGIDGVAHKAALQVNGVSIAVLGNRLNTIHPRRHARLATSLLEHGGALVSEFPLDVPPLAYNFPRRNRIISGLSKGVLVVEAALRSGSLVTAVVRLSRGVKFLPCRVDSASGKRRASLVNKTRCDSCDGTGRNSGKLAIWIALVARRP
ncbi:DNA-processing protein DprA [Escherichia coli]